jgi:hypothetical protein
MWWQRRDKESEAVIFLAVRFLRNTAGHKLLVDKKWLKPRCCTGQRDLSRSLAVLNFPRVPP